MTIKYYTKSVYGKEMIYLAEDGDARMWQHVSGKKTITTSEMDSLCALTGAQFERVFEAVAVS